LQLATLQVLALHAPVPLVTAQVLPHAPQLLTSATSDFSQPLLSVPSQLPKFGAHVLILQLPVAQVAVALVREQLTPHPPQLVTVSSFCSQPSM
jgi:hypothetical protein